jgi:hypothetical protein
MSLVYAWGVEESSIWCSSALCTPKKLFLFKSLRKKWREKNGAKFCWSRKLSLSKQIKTGPSHSQRGEQGDRIGRIIASLATFYFGQVCENCQSFHILGPTCCTVKGMHSFWQKMGWATSWSIFNRLIWSPWCRRKTSRKRKRSRALLTLFSRHFCWHFFPALFTVPSVGWLWFEDRTHVPQMTKHYEQDASLLFPGKHMTKA